jgi:serine/threonine protein kinase
VPGYEILSELGRGGMGVVYRAEQTNPPRLVALKLIRDGALAGPQERARFRVEAEAAARIDHPNVVRIFEIGEHLGLPYFAMELIEGRSLDRRLADQALDGRQSAELLRTLAHAVQQAHDQQIVHRDLKPGNILIADRADEPAIKITDFGLAKRLDTESTALTQDGAVLGTASYMAPEQAAGRVHDVGPAADIYALGAILYELLTGRPPFRGDTWNQTIDRVLNDEPERPTRLRSDTPLALETVCLKCLEKSPSRRYTSARDLGDDLDRYLRGESIVAVPPSDAEQLARWASRDGFTIIGEIGHGPRSSVYRATHGPLNQPVALKVFKPGVCPREEWEARLRRGAAQWTALTHPNVVLPQRSGWWDGSPFVAVEYVPQGSLADRLREGQYSIRQALELIGQLTEIVGYIHRQGVVHGNLKPSNVLLSADGIARLTDFQPIGGLFQGSLPPGDGDPAGLGYLPPEFASEQPAGPGPGTDVYGLGAILYELVTGRPPFVAADARELLDQVRTQEAPPPTAFNPKATPELNFLCWRCLRKNPYRRFFRVYDLSVRIRKILEQPDSIAELKGRRPR